MLTNQVVSPVERVGFKSLSGLIGRRRRSAAAAPAETEHCEPEKQSSAADTAATNDVLYETETKEKTPGAGGETQRRQSNPGPSVLVEEQEEQEVATQQTGHTLGRAWPR
ncbi:hypothetical protein NDU88_009106 [Pleurodeles waltl]|uniref:Uncharacterized protein n=1 Tax=Pleurodeles waltl TaxID=8319 RepID=A0AAV7QRP8_PLEWA|nr:hypothetical protein NDU88_009106 [Pleurodeles waltl]